MAMPSQPATGLIFGHAELAFGVTEVALDDVAAQSVANENP